MKLFVTHDRENMTAENKKKNNINYYIIYSSIIILEIIDLI